MGRTADRSAGTRYEEELVFDDTPDPTTSQGELRQKNGDLLGRDQYGEFNLRSGALPPTTGIGQVLISTDGATLSVQSFAVSDLGEIAVDDDGIVGVVG